MLLRSLLGKHQKDFQLATNRRAKNNESVSSRDQLGSLNVIWQDAIVDIPFYQQLVASGSAPDSFSCLSELQSIPVLTKREIQENPDQFIRKSGPPNSFMTTAGSTGTPLRIGMNPAEQNLMRVVKLADWQQLGYTMDSRIFLIWGHSHLLGTGMRGRFNHLTRKIKDRLLGYQRVDAYRLNRESCERYAAQLLRFGPIGLIGYTSALDLFAQYTPQFRERFHQSNLRFVLATAEPPTRADSLEMMSDLFGCPVVQEYGGAEFGQIAFKVGDEPFRVYADLNYLECEKPRDQQSEKSLLVTSLYPRYLPLIRYRVGDSVAGEKTMDHGHVCQFNSIAGRINDVIRLDDGDSIHSVAIFHCIHQEATIRNIQMVVSDLGIEIRLASTCTSDSQISDRIRTRLGEVHPSLLRANIVFVEDLETNRAGKRRWFIDERKEERNQ